MRNESTLESELQWFTTVLETGIALYFEQECPVSSVYEIVPHDISGDSSGYAQFIQTNRITFEERFIIILSLVPFLKPQLLDTFFINNKNLDRPFTEFGGWKGNSHGGFLPTFETAVFILAGDNLSQRLSVQKFLKKEGVLFSQGILKEISCSEHEPLLSAPLVISDEYLSKFIYDESFQQPYSSGFPAQKLTTNLDWDDLVLDDTVFSEVDRIITWIKHEQKILSTWQLGKFIKPGYRAMFYGPPGTGKTLTVSLIGKSLGIDVYRVDLSMVVSKYIGETEKNLAQIFDIAENKNWILFFDEADALFSKRTQTSSSNDRHANQEVAYLLQRIESYNGVVILATNFKANIDDAFSRRFQSSLFFPMPDKVQRKSLWKKMLDIDNLCESVNFQDLAGDYEISGGAMINVIRFAAIRTIQRESELIEMQDLVMGVRRELIKEGKTG